MDLKNILKGKVVILCLGNIDRADDGLGPYIARAIKGKLRHEVIDAGMTPENYTGVIRRLEPDTIILIDTIYFGGEKGEIRFFSGEDLHSGKISTHDVSPKLLVEYLRSSTKANVYILGVNPGSDRLGGGLSREVRDAAQRIATAFLTDNFTLLYVSQKCKVI